MHIKDPLYLVDTNSPLIYAWPSYVIFLGNPQTPAIREPDSPVDLVISFSFNSDQNEQQDLLNRHNLGQINERESLPMLCVTNPCQVSKAESALYHAGLFPINIDDKLFRMNPNHTLDSLRNEDMVKENKMVLEALPITTPISLWQPIPYVDHNLNLIILQACPAIWQWWRGGLGPGSIVRCLKNVLTNDIYQKLQKDHPVHQKDQPSRPPAS